MNTEIGYDPNGSPEANEWFIKQYADVNLARGNARDYGFWGLSVLVAAASLLSTKGNEIAHQVKDIAGSVYNSFGPIADQATHTYENIPSTPLIGEALALAAGATLIGVAINEKRIARKLENGLRE